MSLAIALPAPFIAPVAPITNVAPRMKVMYESVGNPGTFVTCPPAADRTASKKSGKMKLGSTRIGCRRLRAIERRAIGPS